MFKIEISMNLHSIKLKLEQSSCPEHGKHPSVTITGKTLNMSCCCEKFKEALKKKSEKLITESIQNDISSMFKKL